MGLSLITRRARLALVRDAILDFGGGAVHVYGNTYPGQDVPSPDPPLFIRSLDAADLVLHPTDASMSLEVEGNVALSGTANWARFVDGAGTPVDDRSAGPPGSGAHLIVTDNALPPTANLYPGGVVTLAITFIEAL